MAFNLLTGSFMPAAKTPTKAKRKAPAKKPAKRSTKKRSAVKRAPVRVKRSVAVEPQELNHETQDPFQVISFDQPAPPTVQTWSVMPELPPLDLDELVLPAMPSLSVQEEEPAPSFVAVTLRSRLSFYLGVFFGAIVVNVLVVALLAIVSV